MTSERVWAVDACPKAGEGMAHCADWFAGDECCYCGKTRAAVSPRDILRVEGLGPTTGRAPKGRTT